MKALVAEDRRERSSNEQRRTNGAATAGTLGVVIVAAALAGSSAAPRWGVMWTIALAVLAAGKTLALTRTEQLDATVSRRFAFLFGWFGTDAESFLASPGNPSKTPSASRVEGALALLNVVIGVGLFGAAVACRAAGGADAAVGWLAMIGMVLIAHFGLLQLAGYGWRAAGVAAGPVMDWPLAATSVADFWGRRWNVPYRDVSHRFLFRPLLRARGAAAALLGSFAVSGVIHELLISTPAQAGYGGPLGYFLLQPLALTFERSAWGRRLGLGGGWRGRLFAGFVIVGPLPWLFHDQFVRAVIVPFVDFARNVLG